MLDVVMVLTAIALTVVTLAYTAGCDALMRGDTTRDEGRAS